MGKSSIWTGLVLGGGLIFGLTGCGAKSFGDHGRLIETSASERLVWTTQTSAMTHHGRVSPLQIVCAEPSPDTAKAVEKGIELMLKATEPTTGIQGGVGVGYGSAESIAQLTQRMATIQLLRDGLYRACEAYANGAISKVEYSVLLSRFDDTMITMLLAELIAGNFGGELAAIGGGMTQPSPGDMAAANALQDEQSLLNLKQLAALSKGRLANFKNIKAGLEDNLAVLTGGAGVGVVQAIQNLDSKILNEEKLLESLQNALPNLGVVANDSAKTAEVSNRFAKGAGQVVGANISSADRVKIAEHIATMQRKYIENINQDALMVGCLSLFQEARLDAEIKGHCLSLIGAIVAQEAKYLEIKKKKGLMENEAESVWTAVNILANSGHGMQVMRCLYEGGIPLPKDGRWVEGCEPRNKH